MIDLKCVRRGCMKFAILKQNRKSWWKSQDNPKTRIFEERAIVTSVKRKLAKLLFEICEDCKRMASIPQGAFAACKVRCNRERNATISRMEKKEKSCKENTFNMRPPLEGWELTPLKYNSKLMNSIWGLYNRYSVHNFKKNNSNEGVFETFVAAWKIIFHDRTPAAVANNNSQIM
ncbi:uncharacterized protein LOC724558 [Apis mellifera]|uniref:Uncharacterized protein LOC724558 n=1 Tax=Apis mellifera TaxID=7460 RepID=A0A7M7FY62_APIME|nr:uncharacterized protein LOC724558 [Apis mellifera]|eukprot:XP_001120447.3 uncharacterized protein LOC724558 [Apis mellifera]